MSQNILNNKYIYILYIEHFLFVIFLIQKLSYPLPIGSKIVLLFLVFFLYV